jgi:hypothetical protein
MRIVAHHKEGVIVLLRRQEPTGEILERVQSPDAHRRGTRKWDPRLHGIGAQILRDLGVGRMRVMAQNGGVLVRAGHTEAGCDLAELAGLTPAAVICEIMNPDGAMARLPVLLAFAGKHGLKVGTIADLIRHRSENEKLIERVADRTISTPYGPFRLCVYHDKTVDEVHYALVKAV